MSRTNPWTSRILSTVPLGVALSIAALGGLAAPGCDNIEGLSGEPCSDNSDCDDGVFCNGAEICVGSICAELAAPDCNDGLACTIDACDEERRSCVNEPPDLDGDGATDATCIALDGAPLGTDCDDDDDTRFPGNVERCDEDHHDEDCNPNTFGRIDADGDGLTSAECCNEHDDGLVCGTDCDDDNGSVVPGVQLCDPSPDKADDVLICGVDGSWTNTSCFDPGACVDQPNGHGVCVPL